MVMYNETFKENVNGKIMTRFKLDDKGNPINRVRPDGLKSYTIDLSLVSDNPDLSNVTYKLDSSTYLDPVLESNDRGSSFRQQMESYGDYILTVEAQVGSRVYPQRASLFELLEEGHKDSKNLPQIDSALKDIKNN